jgi:inner membrane protein
MASVGHLAVGLTAARLYRTGSRSHGLTTGSVIFWSALSFLPDADVVGFALGVRYGDEWGHRGATHSLAFSLALGAAAGLVALIARRPAWRTGVTASLVLASHALLDTLTDGGLGCALFWPFDLTRYFAPWTPIPVSPIGPSFLSPYGMYVAAVEILLFAPLIWFALRPRIRPAIPIVLWLVALWLFLAGDPVRERVIRAVLRDDTVFAEGFSDAKLSSIERGDAPDDVRTRLGPPMREVLDFDRLDGCGVVFIEGGVVGNAWPVDPCQARGVQRGAPRAVVEALGVPSQHCWLYSRSPDDGYYRARVVCFQDNRVTQVVRRWVRE